MSQKSNDIGFTAQHGPNESDETTNPGEDRQLSEFEIIADEIGKLVTDKNEAYGSAYIKTAQFLLLLFPNGVHIHRYRDMLLMVRILDKLMRLATRPDAFGESPYRDIAGYGVLGVHSDKRFERKKNLDAVSTPNQPTPTCDPGTSEHNKKSLSVLKTQLDEAMRVTSSTSTCVAPSSSRSHLSRCMAIRRKLTGWMRTMRAK